MAPATLSKRKSPDLAEEFWSTTGTFLRDTLSGMRPFTILFLVCALLPRLHAQQQVAPADSNAWTTKTIQLKYMDPEQLRSLFSHQSYVMEPNREVKVLKVNGPQSFIKEVEDVATQLDTAPPVATDLQVTVYLLATTGKPLPDQLKGIDSSLTGLTNSQTLRLADSQVLRLRQGQVGEVGLTDTKAAAGPALTRVRVQSATYWKDAATTLISLDGVRCWISKPSTTDSAAAATHVDADFTANIDVTPDKPAVLAEAGTEKPMVLVVRASLPK